ncbi:hypothetical protein [Chryseolinea sp. H1M3-3]|uniref:hypothetical protein n=1 Tax=Chryseolinea sp. H1M3-3 TaxID=3034144 RepID=UPI0023EDD42A|nr:hypothetical protein [Chryseolinea sp. H1M3-3]
MANLYTNNKTFQRAGEILIRSIWLEKRLIDLILLKNNPEFEKDFNTGTISPKHASLRLDWHKNTFAFIIDKFLPEFPEVEKKDKQHVENLYALNEIRDFISHADFSYHRENILFVTKSVSRLAKFDALTFPTKAGDDDGTRVLNLNNEKNFEQICAILDDWEKIIEAIASSYGVEPNKLK